MDTVHKIGRKKTAVARIYLSEGKGNITVNKKDYKDYFTTGTLQYKVQQPLMLTGDLESYDIKVNVYGGGIGGQAGAIRLGITRALLEVNKDYRPVLKAAGLVRRDSRVIERKKPGLKKARRAPQFSKR